MSRHRHEKCCYPMMAAYGGYGMVGYGGAGYGSYGAGMGIRWIYALLVLIVIVLQFGRNLHPVYNKPIGACEGDGAVVDGAVGGPGYSGQLIDNSVLFIIVVFLLILCAGCWSGYGGFGGFGGGSGIW